MPYAPDANNLMLDARGAVALRASLHSAYPGTTGLGDPSVPLSYAGTRIGAP